MQTLNLFPNIQNLGHNSAVPWDPRIWLSLTNADTEANPNNNLRQADLSCTILHRNIPGLRFLILPGPVFGFHCEYFDSCETRLHFEYLMLESCSVGLQLPQVELHQAFSIWMQEITCWNDSLDFFVEMQSFLRHLYWIGCNILYRTHVYMRARSSGGPNILWRALEVYIWFPHI